MMTVSFCFCFLPSTNPACERFAISATSINIPQCRQLDMENKKPRTTCLVCTNVRQARTRRKGRGGYLEHTKQCKMFLLTTTGASQCMCSIASCQCLEVATVCRGPPCPPQLQHGASAALPGSIGFESVARVSHACTRHLWMRCRHLSCVCCGEG